MNKEEIEQIQFEQTKSLLFQLQEANNKIEKIKEYMKIYSPNTLLGAHIDNILSIIDGSDE